MTREGTSTLKATSASSVHPRAARRLHRRIGLIVALALVGGMTLNGGLYGPRVVAASAAITNTSVQGFDGCQGHAQPNKSQMQSFWTGSPLSVYFVYIGGSMAYCPGPTAGISQSWFTSVLNQGWGIVGVWVGPQCCGTQSATVISTITTNAYNQGVAEADKAANQWCSWGQCYGLAEPIAYDFESDTDPTAEHYFLRGWTAELQARFFNAGAYASVCQSTNEVGAWASLSPTLNFIWPADWDGRDTVYGLKLCPPTTSLSNSIWSYDQRFHQFLGTHPQKYNGVTLSTDSDCANGPVLNWLVVPYQDGGESTEGAGPTEDPQCVT